MQNLAVPLLLLLTLLTYSTAAYRILAFLPFNGRTHHIVYRPVLRGLADAGHQVVYLSPYPLEEPHVGIQEIIIDDCYTGFNSKFFVENSKRPWFLQVAAVYEVTLASLTKVFNQPQIQRLLASEERFDAVLTETCFFQEAVAALHHRFGVVGLELCALGERSSFNAMIGLSDNAAYVIDYRSPYTDTMSLWQRLHNSIITTGIELTALYYRPQMEQVAKILKYPGSEDRPKLEYIIANLSLVLINSHPALSYPYPVAPHVKKIGGVVIYNEQPSLSQDLELFLDSAEHGAILLSFGTNLDVISEGSGQDMFGTLMKVFGKLKQKVIVKWGSPHSSELPSNVRVVNWVPQQRILGHNRTALFLTHGGYSSVYEAAFFGVPIIGIPYFGDQPKNVTSAVAAGFCLRLDHDNITEKSLAWAIKEVLGNKRYTEEARRRSEMLRTRQTTPVQEAVYWIEYAIKFPNALTPRSAFLTYVQLNFIEVKIILFCTFLVTYCLLRGRFRSKTVRGKVKTS